MQRQQQGFTLIELVIVIVILGILSAFALPRFADLGGDARVASLEGAAGSMRSAASITRSACLASADCDASVETGETVSLEGASINLTYGYPAASSDGIMLAAQLDQDYTLDDGATPVEIRPSDVAADDTCHVTYTAATSGTDGVTAPAVATATDDC